MNVQYAESTLEITVHCGSNVTTANSGLMLDVQGWKGKHLTFMFFFVCFLGGF